MAELLADFRTLQYYIAAVECNPANMDDYYTEGWAQLRQCALDGQHILNCAADVTVPRANGGPEEQERAELMQCVRPTMLFPSSSFINILCLLPFFSVSKGSLNPPMPSPFLLFCPPC